MANKKLYFKIKSSDPRRAPMAMQIEVELIDKKEKFGRVLCLISPVNGTGEIWVNEGTLIIK